MDKYAVGIDFGGTKIAIGLVNLKGKVIKKIKISSKGKRSSVIEEMFNSIESVLIGIDKKDVLGIGIGAPGPLDYKKGVLLNLVNLPEWRNVTIKEIVQSRFGLNVRLDNDANCAALGEAIFGAGKNERNLVCLTLGTGLGGGIIFDKKIYHGIGNAGEIGHMSIVKNGLRCNCGSRGCLEEYVSIRGVKREGKKALGKILDPLDLTKLAEGGNKKAVEAYAKVGRCLGAGLANVVNILNPDIIVICGGVAGAGNFILKPAIEEMKKRALSQPCKIVRSKLGEDTGLIGAACLAMGYG